MTTLTTLWRALESNYGLLVLAGMFYLGWKMSGWKGGLENRLSGVESLVERHTKKTDEIYTVIIGRFGRPVEHATSPVIGTEKPAPAFGIELRDWILQMKGKSHAEVDEHSPA